MKRKSHGCYGASGLTEDIWGLIRRHMAWGFDQAAYGLELSVRDITRLKNITKDLYPDIAMKHNTSSDNVDRNIRTLVEIIWDYGNRELLQGISRENLEEKPANTEFFVILTKHLKMYIK